MRGLVNRWKKTTGIIFILIANIIMLVHHFVPHHFPQPEENICQIAFHIKDAASKECPHNHTQLFLPQSDSHNTHTWNIEDCLLEEIHIRVDENNQIVQSDDIGQQPLILVQNEILIVSEPVTELFTHEIKPGVPPVKDPDFVRNNGLRAPPYC